MTEKTNVLCLTFCLLAAAWLPVFAADPDPVQGIAADVGDTLLNPDWQYLANSATDPAVLAEGAWGAVDLPHTWNAFDAVDAEPGYRRDAGWYRKWLRIAEPSEGMRYLLYFESANMKADVFINGHHAGGHVGGYLGFTLDVTELLDLQADNQILVRVDNGIDRNLIPSQKSDFVLYGGITRDVFLQLRPASYIRRVQIDTPGVSSATGKLVITTELAGDDGILRQGQLHLTVSSPDGSVVSRASEAIATGSVQIEMPPVESPLLWSPDTPNLYRLTAALVDRSGAEIHLQEESFGFRWYEFSDAGDFMLNGERLLLRGTHRHEEHAAYGSAMPNALHLRDMEMIKEIGANFVRLGHYPQDPEVYRAADRLGLILWDELPWCRGGMGETAWQQNTESMLREMITQNRNHPSVFFWSLGNEIYWQPDFEGGGDEARLNEYLAHLNAIAHKLDPGRPTSIRKYYAGFDIVDVFSPSIWAGWYGGGYHQYADALTDAQKKYPRLLHMEYGASSHVGRYDPAPPGGEGMSGGQTSVAEMVNQSGVVSVAKYGDWSESYAVDLFDWHLKVSESQPHFGGNAQWAFKDFATPLRPENPIPYMNQKGLVDRAGRPKEAYWVFKSRWTTDPMFCHLFGQGWTDRSGEKDQVHQVRAYCNTDTAKLIVNGEEQGVRQRNHDEFPASGLFWDITLREGVNQLEVMGLEGDKAVAGDRLEVSYTSKKFGKLADIHLEQDLREDGSVLITALAIDRNGRLVQDSRERVYFSHVNPGSGGQLRMAQGTPDGSDVVEMANGKAEIIFDPAGHGDSPAVIEVRSQNHKGSYIEIDRSAAYPAPVSEVISAERARIETAAAAAMALQVRTVTASNSERSPGGIHDYYSEGDYWWPDPDDPDGPYIRRDGESNPDNFNDHREAMIALSDLAGTLATAYLLTGEQQYADRVAEHLQAWFVTGETRMNPWLEHAQAIKGRSSGRSIGLIDTVHLAEVALATKCLGEQGALPPEIYEGTVSWFREYLGWLNSHPFGLREKNHANNHSVAWSLQAAAFATLVEDQALIAEIRGLFRDVYLPLMMAPDGSFPAETARTKPYGYSLFMLDLMAGVATLVSTQADNMWSLERDDGRSISDMYGFIVPYIENPEDWPFPPDVQYGEYWPAQHASLVLGAVVLQQPAWAELWLRLETDRSVFEVMRNMPVRNVLLWLPAARSILADT